MNYPTVADSSSCRERDDAQDPSGSDSRANEPLRLGIYLLQETDEPVREKGQSAKKVGDLWGTATEYLVTAEDGADLLLRDTRWDNGQRDVRVVERHDTPPPYDTVVGRLRISVDPIDDDLFMELRQARITRTGRAQAAVATLEELDEGSGTSVSRALRDLGAQTWYQGGLARSYGPNPGADVLPLPAILGASAAGRLRANKDCAGWARVPLAPLLAAVWQGLAPL